MGHTKSTHSTPKCAINISCSLIFVGENRGREFGFTADKDSHYTNFLTDLQIHRLYSATNYSIFVDTNGNYWSTGDSEYTDYIQYTFGASPSYYQNTTVIDCFNNNNINIYNICVNPIHDRDIAYWITDKRKVILTDYDNLKNDIDTNEYPFIEELTTPILSILDIQYSNNFHFALFENPLDLVQIQQRIINKWSDPSEILIPLDIIQLIFAFNPLPNAGIYYQKYQCIRDNTRYYQGVWEHIPLANASNIIKIITSGTGSLFALDSNGCAFEVSEFDMNICIEPRFKDIRVKDIACTKHHALIMSCANNVFQYGVSNMWNVDGLYKLPRLMMIEELKEHVIIEIGCGYKHAYCKSVKGEYFMFGSNEFNECLKYDTPKESWVAPHCINVIVEMMTNGCKIKNINLGLNNTKIIIQENCDALSYMIKDTLNDEYLLN